MSWHQIVSEQSSNTNLNDVELSYTDLKNVPSQGPWRIVPFVIFMLCSHHYDYTLGDNSPKLSSKKKITSPIAQMFGNE